MESVIGLRFSTLPSPSVRMPSGFHAARATKPHLRLSHSSFSFPKDPTLLPLGRSSSLSLSKTSGGRPLDHAISPISCLIDGSLLSMENRYYKGAASVPWASAFGWNISSGNRSNHKANAGPEGGSSSSLEHDSDSQKQQQLVNTQQGRQQAPDNDLAETLRKALERIAEEKDIGKPHSKVYDQIMNVVKRLKCSQNYNLAAKLLMAFEPFVKEQESLATIKFNIMDFLYRQGNYQEAFVYWIQLCEMKSPQTKKHKFSKMQSDLFSTMIKVVGCLTEKVPGKEIPTDLWKSMVELKKIDILELMMTGDEGGLPAALEDDEECGTESESGASSSN